MQRSLYRGADRLPPGAIAGPAQDPQGAAAKQGGRGGRGGRGGAVGLIPAADAPACLSRCDRARKSRLRRQLLGLPWRRSARWRPGRTEPAALAGRPQRSAWRTRVADHSRCAPGKGMPAFNLSDSDSIAVAEYIHSVLAQVGRQARPPGTPDPADQPASGQCGRRRRLFQDQLRLLPFDG